MDMNKLKARKNKMEQNNITHTIPSQRSPLIITVNVNHYYNYYNIDLLLLHIVLGYYNIQLDRV